MLRELLAKLAIQVDGSDLEKFAGQIEGIGDKLKKFGGLFVGGLAAGAVKDFVGGQIEAGDALGDTAAKLGVTTEELQRFQFAAKASGGEVESATTALRFLNKNVGEAAGGNATLAAAFAKVGVSVKDSNGNVAESADLLPGIAQGISELGSQGEKTAAAMAIFGKGAADILPLLDSGEDGVNKLFEEFDNLGGGLSDEFVAATGEAADQLDRLEFVVAGLKSEILTGILPAITTWLGYAKKLGGGLVKFARTTTFVETATKALGAALAVLLAQRLYAMLPQIYSQVRAFMALRTSIFGASVPVLLIVAVLALLYLAFDDLWSLMNGGDSVIGDFLDKFGGIGASKKLADDLRAAWDQINKSFAETGPFFSDLAKSLGGALATALPYVIQGFVFLVKVIAAAVTLLGAFIASIVSLPAAIKKGDFSQIQKTITGAGDAIFGKNLSTIDPKTGGISSQNVGGLFGETLPIPPGAKPPVDVKQDNKNNITIYGASDPKGTAEAVSGALGKLQNGQNAQAFAAVAQ